ncbi:MAG: hypothetical protein BIFFINMI_02083 [Phycisphaerae bacterium]|nr:hypothetical protein [Phycisphaerae bacterium]
MPLIHELTLRGLLSFGPETPPLQMRPLNVLIGPNGSGKSNLVEAIDLLRSSATKLANPIRRKGSGGISEWIWKGAPSGTGSIKATLEGPKTEAMLDHLIEFRQNRGQFKLVDEQIRTTSSELPRRIHRLPQGEPVLDRVDKRGRRHVLSLHAEGLDHDESIVSQLRDPYLYPDLFYLSTLYPTLMLYRDWAFGRNPIFRMPQAADLPGSRLEEDFSNLGLYLNHLRSLPAAKKVIIERLRDLYEGLEDFDVRVKGGTVELFLTERDFIIPAGRLSDGTLRYLCLLAILCDPEPPPLICIEEPELGLHPDMLPKLADLMIAASARTQLVVTTHSDILVDALTEQPESVVVVEKHGGQTTMRRLDAKELAAWLEKYRLGELWTRGQIGGTRW